MSLADMASWENENGWDNDWDAQRKWLDHCQRLEKVMPDAEKRKAMADKWKKDYDVLRRDRYPVGDWADDDYEDEATKKRRDAQIRELMEQLAGIAPPLKPPKKKMPVAKPCSCCKAEKIAMVSCDNGKTVCVKCAECGIKGPSAPTESEAIVKWDNWVDPK